MPVGDTCTDAPDIDAMVASCFVTGSTRGQADDYAPSCATGSASPDAVFRLLRTHGTRGRHPPDQWIHLRHGADPPG